MINVKSQISDYIDIYDGKLVLVSVYTNLIYIVSIERERIERVIQLEQVGSYASLFRGFLICGDYLLLIPYNADNFYSVKLDTGKIDKRKFIGKERESLQCKYLRGIRVKSDAWCIGEKVNNILCLNIQDDIILNSKYEYEKGISWSDASATLDNMIFVPSMNRNAILKIDTIDKNIDVMWIDNAKTGFIDICEMHKKIYLFDKDGNTYLWDMNNSIVKVSVRNDTAKIVSKHTFCYDDKVYRFCYFENSIYVQDSSFNVQRVFTVNTANEYNGTIFNNGIRVGNKYFFQTRYGKLLAFDFENCRISEIAMSECDKYKEYEYMALKTISKSDVLHEALVDLDSYIKLCCV